MTEFYQVLGRRTDDTGSQEKNDLELVKFDTDGGTWEHSRSTSQPSSGQTEGCREDIHLTRRGHHITVIYAACNEGVHKRQQRLFR